MKEPENCANQKRRGHDGEKKIDPIVEDDAHPPELTPKAPEKSGNEACRHIQVDGAGKGLPGDNLIVPKKAEWIVPAVDQRTPDPPGQHNQRRATARNDQ